MSRVPACSSITNRQRRVPVRAGIYRTFIRKVERDLYLAGTRFDVTLVDDCETARLNLLFRKKAAPADVLSFSWRDGAEAGAESAKIMAAEFAGFLGDIVISVEAARRNARQEEQSLEVEIQQLILHGLLHLLGYDHETDEGEMNCLEIRLRRRLNIEGEKSAEAKRLVSRCGMQKKSVH